MGFKSGDPAGPATGPPHPIGLPSQWQFKQYYVNFLPKCGGGAPYSCIHNRLFVDGHFLNGAVIHSPENFC
jgi:hypothetical protein